MMEREHDLKLNLIYEITSDDFARSSFSFAVVYTFCYRVEQFSIAYWGEQIARDEFFFLGRERRR